MGAQSLGSFAGGAGGGGGFQGGTASATSGDAKGQSGSGNKQFNFGANPNTAIATQSISATLANPFVLIAAVAAVWLITRKKRK